MQNNLSTKVVNIENTSSTKVVDGNDPNLSNDPLKLTHKNVADNVTKSFSCHMSLEGAQIN